MKTFFNILILISCQLFIVNLANAQVSDPKKTNSRAIKLYQEGMEKISDSRFDDAVSYFLQAIYLDSNYIDAYLSLAGVYQEVKKKCPCS
jgi:outer membrane protein assembly factor BamD (BamD/ComL family)